MTSQEKRTYLESYRFLNQQVRRTMDELVRWRSRSVGIAPHCAAQANSTVKPGLQSGEQMVQLEKIPFAATGGVTEADALVAAGKASQAVWQHRRNYSERPEDGGAPAH